MKNTIIAIILALFCSNIAKADEGMWLLNTLGKNIKEMKRAGLKLSPEEIYSANHNSIKDAIVIFGGGCTGEIVSDEGLLFTNHHCGYSAVQDLSSIEHNWLKNGFWAKNHEEELPSKISVTFIREIIDVTDEIVNSVNDSITIETVCSNIQKRYENPQNNISASVEAMFAGNQYILFVKETFGDVRLVGVPPESIGKFGGDTDNWMWPRHTGDFSIFRVYSTKENKSTKEYCADNVPYKPLSHLTVSTKGVKEGDFSMIIGFPGSTNRFMTTWEIDTKLNIIDPIRITVRGEKQKIWWNDMISDPKIKLMYANKYARSSNYWKNSIGMSQGIRKLNLKNRKQKAQDDFNSWLNEDDYRKKEYGDALNFIREGHTANDTIVHDLLLLQECLSGMEALSFARNVSNIKDSLKFKETGEKYFKNYSSYTDRTTTEKMLQILSDSLKGKNLPDFLKNIDDEKISEMVDYIYKESIFTSYDRFEEALKSGNFIDEIKNDTITKLSKQIKSSIPDDYFKNIAKFQKGLYYYEKGLLEMNKGKNMYPDANFTIRLSYGNIKSYEPADAILYNYYTTLEGVIAKEDKNNPEFEVENKLKELFEEKDYGRWADSDGKIHVNFLSTNDITGGNSGSPVLNSKGELIGLAFDGNWEAMSGDVAFEPNLQRTISLDIRYLLFIVDKYAGANNIIEELTLN